VIEDLIPNEELIFRDKIIKFVKENLDPISVQVETSGEIPEVIVEKMRELGLFGLSIPEKFGGLGLSTLGEILVRLPMSTKAPGADSPPLSSKRIFPGYPSARRTEKWD
jgi:alkylation response protein AidB-like acyl-CoA dehydrogenase